MDDSFFNYRSNESEDEETDMSIDMSFTKRKNMTKEKITIPDSDEGSNIENEDSFNIIKPKRCNPKLKIVSDSESEDDYGKNEDSMIMSAATRLSIFGIKPLEDNSDDSDFIESNDEEDKNVSSSDKNILDTAPNLDTIAPITSTSLNDVSVTDVLDIHNVSKRMSRINVASTSNCSDVPDKSNSPTKLDMSSDSGAEDNSLQIISQTNSPVIELNTDDEDEVQEVKMESPEKAINLLNTSQPKISSFMKDPSYPNSGFMYVKKQIKDNEINKLNSMKLDLQRVNYLLETMNMTSLSDNGNKLRMRKEELLISTKKQAEKVSNMIVEPDPITEKNASPLDPWKINSFEDVENDAVKPSRFGHQDVGQHMAQRNLTLKSLHSLHSSLDTRPSEDTLADTPRGLKTQLMSHQQHALAWLTWRERQKPRGGILADDMGLGKTLTMISLIVHSKENMMDEDDNYDSDNDENTPNGKLVNGGTLVVCPASLLNQWHNEIISHCKKNLLKVHVHHGLKREVRPYRLAENDVVITTYNLVQRENEKRGALMKIFWERVILDEAHTVRNYKSLTANAVFQLRSSTRWCLTGTPLHNKDLDLFALLKFLRCKPFDDITMWKKWIDNKSTGGQERLYMIMKTLLLRRTKIQLQQENRLLCLPEKNITPIEVNLSNEEKAVYLMILKYSQTLLGQFIQQRAERNGNFVAPARNKKKNAYSVDNEGKVKTHQILVLLLRLRQICCHAGLIHTMLNDEEAQQETDMMDMEGGNSNALMPGDRIEDLWNLDNLDIQTNLKSSKVMSKMNPVFDLEKKSAKIEATLDCLQTKVFIHKNDKAVVVSQWTSMLSIVENKLKNIGVDCETLSGKVSIAARHDIVKNFNDPTSKIQVLLLSLCAGGVGLNLVGGNHLLLLDLHWNPQLEAQAQDRIYRVGQTKPVFIYKLMCTDTVEQHIKTIQDKKLALAESALTGAKITESSKLTINDIKLMFNML